MAYPLDSRTYSKALMEDRLLGLKCRGCGAVTCPPKMSCQECAGTDLEIAELSGRGKIATFTTTYVAPLGREVEAPYTIVMVALDEGPWIAGNLVGIDPDRAGMALMGRRVKLGHKLFPGDGYSGGGTARPLFRFED